MESENMYIPQADDIEVTELECETIEYLGYPELLELDFDEIIVL